MGSYEEIAVKGSGGPEQSFSIVCGSVATNEGGSDIGNLSHSFEKER